MGVHGLSTYLSDHRRTLSAREARPRLDGPSENESALPIVVDGWWYVTGKNRSRSWLTFRNISLIYKLFEEADYPWVYGGEYELFAERVSRTVEGFREVGLEPHFVFDGMYTFNHMYI